MQKENNHDLSPEAVLARATAARIAGAWELSAPVLAALAPAPTVGEGAAIERRARKDVVRVRRVAAPVDDRALFGELRLLGEVVLVGVQVGEARRDRHRPVQHRPAATSVTLPWSGSTMASTGLPALMTCAACA